MEVVSLGDWGVAWGVHVFLGGTAAPHTSLAWGGGNFLQPLTDAAIRVYDVAGNVIETHERTGDFKEWWCNQVVFCLWGATV